MNSVPIKALAPSRAASARLDAYAPPTPDALLADLSQHARAVVLAARSAITRTTAARETLQWLGQPWGWTFVYAPAGRSQPKPAESSAASDPDSDPDPVASHARSEGAVLYIVPQSPQPILAASIPLEQAKSLAGEGARFALREGMLAGCQVGLRRWAFWLVGTKALAEEIATLAAGPSPGRPPARRATLSRQAADHARRS